MSWLPDIAIAAGVVGSVGALLISMRRSRSDVSDTIVAGYDKLRIAMESEIGRLSARILEQSAEIKTLRQEIVTLRSDLNMERLKTETSDLTRRLAAADAENAALKGGNHVLQDPVCPAPDEELSE